MATQKEQVEQLTAENGKLQKQLEQANEIVTQLNQRLTDLEKGSTNTPKSTTITVEDKEYIILAPSVGIPTNLQAKHKVGAKVTANELAENQELVKDLLKRKVGFIKEK